MSAPVADRPPVRTAPRRPVAPRRAAVPPQRGSDRAARYGAGGPDTAARRAYARRDERLRRSTGAARAASGEPTRRAQFVLLVMGLLVTGLVLTLGLSTAAAADSYRLQAAREQASTLTEQVEALRRSVAIAGSPTELARRAEEMGMVPVRDAARLVVAPDGSVTVVGDPSPVPFPAPPQPVVPPAPAVPPAAGGAAPGAVDPGAVAPEAVPGPATEDAAVAADGAEPDPAADPAAGPGAAGPPATDPAAGAAGTGPATDAAADPAAAGAN